MQRHLATLALLGTPKHLCEGQGLDRMMYQARLTVFLTVIDTIEAARAAGVEWLSLYAFSTENWKRPGSAKSTFCTRAVSDAVEPLLGVGEVRLQQALLVLYTSLVPREHLHVNVGRMPAGRALVDMTAGPTPLLVQMRSLGGAVADADPAATASRTGISGSSSPPPSSLLRVRRPAAGLGAGGEAHGGGVCEFREPSGQGVVRPYLSGGRRQAGG